MNTIRRYLPYAVILTIGALIAAAGLTLAHYNDRTEYLTPAVAYCAAADSNSFPTFTPMPDYCYQLADH